MMMMMEMREMAMKQCSFLKPFNFSADYKVALKNFISIGRDGYECFKDPAVTFIRDANNSVILQDIMFGALELLSSKTVTTP